jgi:hypothetical protein
MRSDFSMRVLKCKEALGVRWVWLSVRQLGGADDWVALSSAVTRKDRIDRRRGCGDLYEAFSVNRSCA